MAGYNHAPNGSGSSGPPSSGNRFVNVNFQGDCSQTRCEERLKKFFYVFFTLRLDSGYGEKRFAALCRLVAPLCKNFETPGQKHRAGGTALKFAA